MFSIGARRFYVAESHLLDSSDTTSSESRFDSTLFIALMAPLLCISYSPLHDNFAMLSRTYIHQRDYQFFFLFRDLEVTSSWDIRSGLCPLIDGMEGCRLDSGRFRDAVPATVQKRRKLLRATQKSARGFITTKLK